MSSGFRVANFQNRFKRSCASIQGLLSSVPFSPRLFSTKTAREHNLIQPAQTAIPEARAERFFDAEFLKKIERLRLVAKRLSWAGAKGEHAVSRKGFSLEFSDYRNYQPGDDLRYVDWNI